MDRLFTIYPIFTNTAASKFLNGVTGKSADTSNFDSFGTAEMREDAQLLFQELIHPAHTYRCYISNTDKRSIDQVIEIVLATDCDCEANKLLLNHLENRTLVIKGVQQFRNSSLSSGRTEFKIIDAFIIDGPVRGHMTSWAVTADVKFADLSGSRSALGFDIDFLKEIEQRPIRQQKMLDVDTRLAHWRGFLDLLEREAKQRQFTFAYRGYRVHSSGTQLILSINDTLEKSDWQKLKATIGEDVDIIDTSEWDAFDGSQVDEADRIRVGSLLTYDENTRQIIIRLDEDTQDVVAHAKLKLPQKGAVHYSALGDLAQVRLLKSGLDRLKMGRSCNPNLTEFLFDPTEARLPAPNSNIQLQASDLLMRSMAQNASQLKAVEGALQASDLFLIQGPPGTGKTTVIAELCYQIAKRGGRTLIASQSNLAVDNALSKLSRHPAIRALRQGRADRVEDEGKEYLEENVISSWLKHTAALATDHLEQQQMHILELEESCRLGDEFLQFCRANLKLTQVINADLEECKRIDAILEPFIRQRDSLQSQLQSLANAEVHLRQSEGLNAWARVIATIDDKGTLSEKFAARLEPFSESFLQLCANISLLADDFNAAQDTLAQAQRDRISFTVSQMPTSPTQTIQLVSSSTTWTIKLLEAQELCGQIAQFVEDIHPESLLEDKRRSAEQHLQATNAKIETYLREKEGINRKIDARKQRQAQSKEDWLAKYGDLLLRQHHLIDTPIPIPETLITEAIRTYDTIIETIKKAQQRLSVVMPIVQSWVERLAELDEDSEDDLRTTYIDNANVIGITCVQAGKKKFSDVYANFDCVIVDEVSKATPPELLLPMLKGKKIVLVGDHKQLPPLIGDDTLQEYAREVGETPEEFDHLKWSLFKELFEGAPEDLKQMLVYQYRMHPQIMGAINQFYDGQLESRIINADKSKAHSLQPLVPEKQHIVWYTRPVRPDCAEEKVGNSYKNEDELGIIKSLLTDMDEQWARVMKVTPNCSPKEVGLITFYGAQVQAMERRFISNNAQPLFPHLRLRIGTVDRFQGMERQVIIVSLVRNNPKGDIGFARLPERINVAFSRAQELLVIVGSREMFCQRTNSQAREIYRRVGQIVEDVGGMKYV